MMRFSRQVVIKEGELAAMAPCGGDENTIRAQQVLTIIMITIIIITTFITIFIVKNRIHVQRVFFSFAITSQCVYAFEFVILTPFSETKLKHGPRSFFSSISGFELGLV